MEAISGIAVKEIIDGEWSLEKELDQLFDEHNFSDILCDGQCATCLQRDWCLLTPASRYVK